MKNTNILILGIVIILLGAGSYYYVKNNKPADNIAVSPTPTVSTKRFTDSNKTFTFEYNPLFSAVEGDSTKLTLDWELNAKEKGALLAVVTVPRSYMPGTNFSSARMTVGRSSDERSCLAEEDGGENNIVGTPATLSGYPFLKFVRKEGAAGSFYETTSYKGLVDGDCYVVEYMIRSSNIGNYSPDQGIKEFNKSKIQIDLENIIKSFKFLINSD